MAKRKAVVNIQEAPFLFQKASMPTFIKNYALDAVNA